MKLRSLSLLFLAEIAALSLWFVSSAILPDMLREADVPAFRQAALSSGVQIGFVIGALASAIFGIADRYDPRRVFALSALLAGAANLALIALTPGATLAIAARVATGVFLAGVYPVGMKIAIGWGEKDRGFLVGALVGALTLGSALPHLFALLGGAEWRLVVGIASLAAFGAAAAVMGVGLGPFHRKAAAFDPGVVLQAWRNKRVRYAYLGYLGHMWELYAMWAWVAAIALASYSVTLGPQDAQSLATMTAFIAISAGAPACVLAGVAADRFGKAEVAMLAMIVSGASAVVAALTFGGPVWITFAVLVVWGLSIVPDSALFSALVADAAPPENAGSLMTLQTALGFALTFLTVQATPVIAASIGWPLVLAIMALGPLAGIAAMQRLRKVY